MLFLPLLAFIFAISSVGSFQGFATDILGEMQGFDVGFKMQLMPTWGFKISSHGSSSVLAILSLVLILVYLLRSYIWIFMRHRRGAYKVQGTRYANIIVVVSRV